MGQQPADVEAAKLAQLGVVRLVVEQVGLALPQTLMNVHSRGVVLEQRFGHERRSHIVLAGGILDHVFVDHQVVSHAGERSEAHVYFVLAAGRDFMMMGFDLDPQRLHRQHHFGAESLHAVGRGNRKVSLFRARLVAQIRRFLLAGVPAALAGIDFVEGVVNALSVAHVVEYEELRFRAEIARSCPVPSGARTLRAIPRFEPPECSPPWRGSASMSGFEESSLVVSQQNSNQGTPDQNLVPNKSDISAHLYALFSPASRDYRATRLDRFSTR